MVPAVSCSIRGKSSIEVKLVFLNQPAIVKIMISRIGEKACIPNPALKPFEILVGEWKTTGSHPYFPGTVLHGRVSFEWVFGGAFLAQHTELDNPKFPNGIAIFGSDDMEKKFFVLYFDERGVSRKYDMTIKDNQVKWWRDDPAFSQRMNLTIKDGGNEMESSGEMSQKGKPWEKDLELTYSRIK
jgi:hypothetical protein